MARNSTKARRICFEAHKVESDGFTFLRCHVCGYNIDPLRDKWRADHIRRYAEGGEDTAENLWPICLDCDGGVGGKAVEDNKEVKKGRRVRDKHFGIKRPSVWYRPEGVKFNWKKGRYTKDDSDP